MPAGDNYQLTLEAIYEGQAVVNVFHFRQNGADGTGDVRLSLANIFEAQVWPLIQARLVNEYAKVGYLTKGIKPNETQTLLTLNAAVGGIVEDGLPPNSIMMMTNYGLRLGLKGTGRTMFTGIPEADTEGGILNLTYQGTWQTYIDKMLTTMTDAVLLWSFDFGVLDPAVDVIRLIQRMEVRPRLRTLRSRTIGAFGA